MKTLYKNIKISLGQFLTISISFMFFFDFLLTYLYNVDISLIHKAFGIIGTIIFVAAFWALLIINKSEFKKNEQ